MLNLLLPLPLSMLVLASLPLVAHAALPCKELEARVLALDERIACQSRGDGTPQLAVQLERNYLALLHESVQCRSRDLAARALELRKPGARLNCSSGNP